MSFKAWVTGILVALGALAGYGVHVLNSDSFMDSVDEFSCAPAIVIFEQKKRCGFVDLGEQVTLVGDVRRAKTHNDGDFSVDVIPDPGYERLLYYKGHSNRGYVHTEFMPCERTYEDVEVVLQEVKRRFTEGIPTRVKITGRWAYDGVDHRGEWKEELENCLETRDPDPTAGWTEIHPAYQIEILE